MVTLKEMQDYLDTKREAWKKACAENGVNPIHDAEKTLSIVAWGDTNAYLACLMTLKEATHSDDPKEWFNALLECLHERVDDITQSSNIFPDDLN